MSSFHSLCSLLQSSLSWRKQRVETLLMLLQGVIDQGSVKLWRLASACPSHAKPASTIRRFERFFASQTLDPDWRAGLCWQLVGRPRRCDLIFDRTQWMVGKKPANVLVLSARTRRFTLPLFWLWLPHKGTCHAGHCAELLDQFIALFGCACINEVLGDREFGSAPMVDMLLKRRVNFTLRAKSELLVSGKDGAIYQLSSLCRNHRASFRSERSFRLKAQQAEDALFVACGGRTRRTVNTHDQMILLTTHSPASAIRRYRNRWCIETQFANLKSRGFNLAQSHMTARHKLDLLLGILAIASAWISAIVGKQKKGIRRKTHGYREQSWFRYALSSARKALRRTPDIMIDQIAKCICQIKRVG